MRVKVSKEAGKKPQQSSREYQFPNNRKGVKINWVLFQQRYFLNSKTLIDT